MKRCQIIGAVVVSVALGSCASTDLGSPCQLFQPNNSQVSPVPGRDIIQTGSGECQQFVCASFSGSSPLCSETCTVAGASCSNGLVCRSAVLTPTLLPTAQSRTQGQFKLGGPPDDFQLLLGSVTSSLFCGPKP